MFRCPGWVTSSRVFSTETVDYVLIYMKIRCFIITNHYVALSIVLMVNISLFQM